MASPWTSNIDRDPRYRGAEEIVAAAGYQVTVGEGVITAAHEETGESRRFRSRKEFLAFAAALASGEPPPSPRRSAGIRNGPGFGERVARASAPPPDEAGAETDLAKLQALCRALVIERDAWKAKAEARTTGGDGEPADNAEKYRALKKFIAREFHPDQVRADGIERLVRTEVFKTIWAHIEALERTGRS
jgi:hypothetical protein